MDKNDVVLELSQELSNVLLPVKGEIPSWLSGTLVRNGPVQFSIGKQQVEHWFDGLGMLHAFSFQNGRVKYTNKFLRSKAYHEVVDKGTFNYIGFASDPCRTLFKRLACFFFPSTQYPIHNANINVAKLADQYIALYETPLPVKFDKQTLETIGVFDYQDELPKSACFESAHPHVKKEESINYLVDYGFNSKYIIYRVQKGSEKREVIAEIPVEYPAYMHSFAITENYIILVEYPFVVNPLNFVFRNLPFIKNYQWKPERGTRFLVVEKSTGKVRSHSQTDPFFAFHHVNAYENSQEIILDIVTYPNADVINQLAHHDYMDLKSHSIERGLELFTIHLKRFKLSLETGKISSEVIFSQVHELPRINLSYDGKPYRYVYATDARKPDQINDVRKVYKIDMNTKEVRFWAEKECYPGEPVFIPNPQGINEDDGVLMVVVMDLENLKSFLLCLNAQNLQELGRAVVPLQIPPGLHGQFFF